MSEAKLQKKILDYLDSIGAWAVKTISTNKRGTPDILACYEGSFYAIEVKAPGKLRTLSELQKYQLKVINGAGGVAFAADSLDTVKEIILDDKVQKNYL